jgi:NADH dehydrogenase
VVIVGAGFAGLSAAKALGGAPVDVLVVDRTNHFLFQPLLYQVAAGMLSPADIAMPTRFLLRKQSNALVLMAEVGRIDLERQRVVADEGRRDIPYDFLVVATGARHSYFGSPEWERVAPGLKTLEDARDIRHRFLTAYEDAEKSDDPAERDALLTFVIVGGGATGVELAGVLPTIARRGIRRDFRRIDPARSRFLLLEGGRRLLPSFPAPLGERAQRDLEDLGVECRTNALVTRIEADALYVGAERIPTRTVLWAAGNAASPLVAALGIPTDRAGRALVASDLSLPGYPNVFVVGDAAAAALDAGIAEGTGHYVPAVAPAANQMGAHAARMILRSLTGRPRVPFRYRDRGSLAVVGRGRAVAVFGHARLTGVLAFVTWLFLHLLYLAGFRNRLAVLLQWAYAYFTYRPSARIVGDPSDRRERLRLD